MPMERTPELFELIEEAAVKHIAFGDSDAIRGQYVLCQKRRLAVIAKRLQTAEALLAGLEIVNADAQYAWVGNTVVRCAIQHAHSQVELGTEYGLPLANCDDILGGAAKHLTSGIAGTPLEKGLKRLSYPPKQPCSSWVWSDDHIDDVFGSALRTLVRLNYGDAPLCTLTTDEFEGLMNGCHLLFALLPSLAASALSHTHLIACFPSLGRWGGTTSSSQFITGGTIFISRAILKNPWSVAEHLLHEALHQKLYDFRHGHSLLEQKYLESGVPKKDLAQVCSHWNPEKLSRANYWDTHRTLAAFHVYVHLSLLSQIAEHRSSELEEAFGRRSGMIESRRALDRARYLGEQLKENCWHELGLAGRDFVDWLLVMLDALDPAPAPKGAYFHHVLDLYDGDTRRIEKALTALDQDGSTLHSKFSEVAREEWDEMLKLLTTLGASASLNEFTTESNLDLETESGVDILRIRDTVARTLRSLSHNGYEIPRTSESPLNPNQAVQQMVKRSSDRAHITLKSVPDIVVAAKEMG